MPLTFPSHAAAVLPLKLWRPRWFDGVALVIGSAAPDLLKSVSPSLDVFAHTWWGLVLFAVPATVLLTALTRRAAPAVVAQLPADGGLTGWFGLRDYAALAVHRHRWYVTVSSAWIGACTHRLWDLLTHPSLDSGAAAVPALRAEAFAGYPWWQVLHHASTFGGLVAALLLARHLARTGALRGPVAGRGGPVAGPGGPAAGRGGPVAGRGGPAAGPARQPGPVPDPRRFARAAGLVWLPGVLVQPILPGFTQPQVTGVRLLEIGALGLLVGAAAVSARAARPAPGPAVGRGQNGRMPASASARTTIAAPPELVYDLVADVTRMGEWSPETVRCRWLDGATGPVPGARFAGVNAHGGKRWRTECRITVATRGHEFTFEVTGARVLAVSRWRYEFTPAEGGCVVTETWTDRRGVFLKVYGRWQLGITDRAEHNRQGMERTLERLKVAAETGAHGAEQP